MRAGDLRLIGRAPVYTGLLREAFRRLCAIDYLIWDHQLTAPAKWAVFSPWQPEKRWQLRCALAASARRVRPVERDIIICHSPTSPVCKRHRLRGVCRQQGIFSPVNYRLVALIARSRCQRGFALLGELDATRH
jgi:hypothetical protein